MGDNLLLLILMIFMVLCIALPTWSPDMTMSDVSISGQFESLSP